MTEPTAETPVALTWPDTAATFKVICALGSVRADSPDDPDTMPELMTMGGTVKIAIAPERVRYRDAAGMWRVLTMPEETYRISPRTGELIDSSGRAGVHLLDSSYPTVDPTGYTATATITPDGGRTWNVTFSTVAPESGVIDLAALTSIAASTGSATLEQRVADLEAATSQDGVTDHGALTGLGDDDHLLYALADGTRGAFARPADVAAVRAWINGDTADLSGLTTTAKTTLVAAINEVRVSAAAGARISDTATATGTVWSSSKTDTQIKTAVSAVVGSAPATLDTLTEISAALKNDPNVIQALQDGLAARVSTTAQTLTVAQQDQARANINAAPAIATDYLAVYSTASA